MNVTKRELTLHSRPCIPMHSGPDGALIGGDPARALKAQARVAAFNDAGMAENDIGDSRLPALNTRGVAAVLIACQSARIGDAFSTLDTGTISYANSLAAQSGARKGQRLKVWLESLQPGQEPGC